MTTAREAGRVDDQIETLLTQWDLGEVHAAVELSGGMFLKPMRLVTDRGSFVLREHSFRSTRSAFQFQCDLVNGCADAGIPCARIVLTRDGAIGVEHGEAFVALHEYVKGIVYNWIDWRERKHRGDGFLRGLGGQVARLHRAARLVNPGGTGSLAVTLPPMRFDALPDQLENFENRVAALLRDGSIDAPVSRDAILANVPRMRKQWERLADWTNAASVGALPRQPVHGDVSAVNLVFPEGGATASFIDWDVCHVGWRLYDALGDVLNRPPHEHPEWNMFDTAEVAAYIDGYREAADPAITADELRAVPLFCLARQMEDLRQRLFTIGKQSRDFDETNATLIRRRVEMMEQIEPFDPCN